MLQKRRYYHLVLSENAIEEDEPVMAYIILNEVQPDTTVSVSGLKD